MILNAPVSQAHFKIRRRMSTMVTPFNPGPELAALLKEKFNAEPKFDTHEHRELPIRVEFTLTLPDGRRATFSAGRRDHENGVGFIAEVKDADNDDFTGWDHYDAIGLTWDQAFYSIVNQFTP